jgi:hypothetical protein
VRARLFPLQLLDVVVYAVTVTAVAVVVSAVPSFALGWGLVGVKFALFFVGFGMLGYATFKLRPTPPWKNEDDPRIRNDREEVGIAARATSLIPPRFRLGPEQRPSIGAKLFVASVTMLVTSYLLESVLGVAL